MRIENTICRYIREDLSNRVDARVSALAAIGIESSQEAFVRAAVADFNTSPERQAIAEVVIATARSADSKVPAHITDDELRVNLALHIHLDSLDEEAA